MGKALLPLCKTSALGEERKKAILLAAENEFEKFSYAGARMQSIADKTGVPKSNVHYYFKNKSGLYNAVLEDVVTLWDQAFETLNPEDDPKIVLTRFVQK